MLEILEERLAVGVITNLAIQKDEPPEDQEEDPSEELTCAKKLGGFFGSWTENPDGSELAGDYKIVGNDYNSAAFAFFMCVLRS